MLKQIEVFKAGRHLAMNGRYYEFSEADVAGIAAAYDPAVLASPIVLGHPKTDAPAWGWAASFSVNDAGVLVAEPEKVDAAFAEGVEAGRYRYVSMSLYDPTDPTNPKPGTWYPRHIGYLGAQAPAVKGLAPAFSADAAEAVVFSVPDREIGWVARAVATVVRRLRDYFIEKEGLEAADKIMPAWNDEWLTEIAATVSAEQPTNDVAWSEVEIADRVYFHLQAKFAEAAPAVDEPAIADKVFEHLQAKFAAADTAAAQRAAELDRREAAFAAAEVARRRADDQVYVDDLVSAGRLPPGHKDGVLAIMAHARGDSGGPSFAEGVDAAAAVRQLLDGLGSAIAFSEFAGGGVIEPTDDPAVIAREIGDIQAAAASRGENLSASQAAALRGR